MLRKVLWSLALLLTLAFSLILLADQVELQQVLGISAHDGDTIKVEFPDGHRDKVRYASINAPGFKNNDCFSEEAKERNEELIKGKDLWLELDPLDDGYRRDNHKRLLAHVFLSPERTQTSSVEVRLVAEGYARLDVINPSDTVIRDGQDFDVRYADWIIAAQTEAAKARLGWWGECDDYGESEVIIAVIKQWSNDEIVYIVNRGDEPINLAAGWKLKDPKHELDFSDYLTGECLLPPGGLLRVHSGSVATGRGGEHTACGEPVVDFYWTGHKVWDNPGDEAWLYRPDGSTAYYYYYPLDWD